MTAQRPGNQSRRVKLAPAEKTRHLQFLADPKKEFDRWLLDTLDQLEQGAIEGRRVELREAVGLAFITLAEKLNLPDAPPIRRLVGITPDDIQSIRDEIAAQSDLITGMRDMLATGVLVAGTQPAARSRRPATASLSDKMRRVVESVVTTASFSNLDED